jgi:hypothetical protein
MNLRTVLVLVLGLASVAACAQSATVDTQQAEKYALKMAIQTEYEQEILPAGETPGHLTSEQLNDLRSRIIAGYSEYYTGTLLTGQLSDVLAWADRIAVKPTPRTLTARMESFTITSLAVTGERADAIGSYSIYHVNTSVADIVGHEATAGGTVTLVFQGELLNDGQTWRVSAYQERLVDFVEDPSARTGQEYMPTPSSATQSGSILKP